MLINQEQCNAFLAKGVINKINILFNKYRLTEARFFAPQFSDQHEKINLIVKDGGENDYYTISRIKHKLKEILGREDINLLVEDNVDEEILPIILKHALPFNYENIQALFPYHISSQDNPDEVIITVHIRKDPSVNYNLQQLISTFETATKHEIENKSASGMDVECVSFTT